MRTLLKKLMTPFDLYVKFGVLIFVSFLFPVHWKQDALLKNNGYDLLSLKDTGSYFTGTYWNWIKWLEGK